MIATTIKPLPPIIPSKFGPINGLDVLLINNVEDVYGSIPFKLRFSAGIEINKDTAYRLLRL